MTFDIVTTFKNNIEWCDPFLTSLEKTLENKNRQIIIYDNSDAKKSQELYNKISKYNLNIKYFHQTYSDKGYLYEWIESLKFSTNDKICFVHSDVVFFMKNWDKLLESKIQEYCIVAAGQHGRIKSYFMLGYKDLFLSTDFGFKRIFDNTVRYEHSGLLENRENCTLLFEEYKNLGSNTIFGDFIYIDNKLFFYHQSWSSRSHQNCSCPIPELEKSLYYKRIANTSFIGQFFNHVLDCCNNEEEISVFIQKICFDEFQIVFDTSFDIHKHTKLIFYLKERLFEYYNKIYIITNKNEKNEFIPFIELKNLDSVNIKHSFLEQLNLLPANHEI